MKSSIIICEGRTDATLIQYYIRKALGWSDVIDEKIQRNAIGFEQNRTRVLQKEGRYVQIASAGGSTKIRNVFHDALERNRLVDPQLTDALTDIVVITDRDDSDSLKYAIQWMTEEMNISGVSPSEQISENKWIICKQKTQIGFEIAFRTSLILIPLDTYGALETFLLNALSEQEYDRDIITKGKRYVEESDPEKRYLRKRRDITKAEFNVFFAIRTAEEQFAERQRVLLSIPWEKYNQINKGFELLADL